MYNYNYNPYQQQFNPMVQTQQYQPVQQPTYGLSGRMIDDISNVGANEVNLNGSPSVFIKKDLSEVYIKKWNQNGMIDTSCYRLVVPETPETNDKGFIIEDSIKSLQEALVGIDEKLDKALSPTQQKKAVKKEVEL